MEKSTSLASWPLMSIWCKWSYSGCSEIIFQMYEITYSRGQQENIHLHLYWPNWLLCLKLKFIILCLPTLPPCGVLIVRAVRTKCWLVIRLKDDVSNNRWNIKLTIIKIIKISSTPARKYAFSHRSWRAVLTKEVGNENRVVKLSLGLLLVFSGVTSRAGHIETGLM